MERPTASPAPQPETPISSESAPARALEAALRRPWVRRAAMVCVDAAALFAALWLAYEIGFLVFPEKFDASYRLQFEIAAPLLAALRLGLMWRLGLYRGFTRYTGTYELTNIGWSVLGGTAGLVVFDLLCMTVLDFNRVPKGIVIIDLLLAFNGLAGIRLARRIIGEQIADLSNRDRKRVLILGAGDAGEHVARNMLRAYRDRFQPVAFLAAEPEWVGRRIHGIPVAGKLDDLESVRRIFRADMAVIALPGATPGLLRSLIDKAQQARLEFKLVPELDAVIEGRIEISRMRPVEIEDLLGRPTVETGERAGDALLSGKRVLVTGAGGSIGSELSRQALERRPASLVLLGRGENSIYEIHRELASRAKTLGVALEPVVGDVRDRALVDGVFAKHRPQTVLHAAAHKHVHFMEAQPAEAIKNNVMGTRLVAEAALAAGAERFILISTDKAVRPTGVMGASKRVAEMIVTALDRGGTGKTRFVSVRFGNVLGSRGSVIPLFRAQIAQGGPVTVTDPEVTRYFMTIPEAVRLTIEAGAQGEGGEVFLLDMGEPIKIVDLARQLITLSGLEPGRDIAIEFTGLRPGEKLREELLTAEEKSEPTAHPKIYRSARIALEWRELGAKIQRLEAIASSGAGDEAGLRAMLSELIPDYQGRLGSD